MEYNEHKGPERNARNVEIYILPHYVSCHISCSQAASAIDYLSTINTESTEASAHFEVIY